MLMALVKAIFKLFGEEKGAIWGLADSFELIKIRLLIDLGVSYTQIVGVQTAFHLLTNKKNLYAYIRLP